jgi:hypothetical protein
VDFCKKTLCKTALFACAGMALENCPQNLWIVLWAKWGQLRLEPIWRGLAISVGFLNSALIRRKVPISLAFSGVVQ